MNDETFKMRRFAMYPDDWLNGTTELTLEEEAAYLRICLLIMSRGGAINDNARWLAGVCRSSPRKWESLRQALIDKDKISITDGLIHVRRCQKELEKHAKWSRKQAESGSKGGRVTAERYKVSNKNNGLNQASATAGLKPPSPSPSPSNKSKSDYAFVGKVIKLTEKNLATWQNSYSAIPDIQASLQSRDDWLTTQPEDDQRNWFVSTSAVLKKEHEHFLAEHGQQQESQHGSGVIY